MCIFVKKEINLHEQVEDVVDVNRIFSFASSPPAGSVLCNLISVILMFLDHVLGFQTVKCNDSLSGNICFHSISHVHRREWPAAEEELMILSILSMTLWTTCDAHKHTQKSISLNVYPMAELYRPSEWVLDSNTSQAVKLSTSCVKIQCI